ncbi:MAG: M1 family metallopeptidase [Bacteroidales bacterium]|nr:M1 family metallopeptidase [Bacteroidales bacterium]
MKKNILISALMLVTAASQAQIDSSALETISATPLSNRIASYDITAKLDVDAKMITGSETLIWRNNTNDTVRELMFHTYLNAFKNSQSTYFIERNIPFTDTVPSSDWGYIDIQRMITSDGDMLFPDLHYIQPDDRNAADQTVMMVKLNEPILPGKEIKLSINFISKLPRIVQRTGYERGDFYMVGQWFPKIGVYEPAGMRGRRTSGWNCHQYHYNSEFYADFGTYDVSITVPEKYRVGATGVLIKEATDVDGNRTFQFHADDVIDFAWSASPRFMVMNDTWKGKGIRLLYMPEHGGQAERYMSAIKNAMEFLDQKIGEFPYPSITIVDVPFYAQDAAAMEYPMLFTTTTLRHLPSNIKLPEQIVVHEFAHNYFQSVVATNEFEEAWLDEGMAAFFEAEIMDKYYGDGSMLSAFSLPVGVSEYYRTNYTQWPNPAIATIDNYSWKYPTHTYDLMAYSKPMVMLKSLKGMMGEDLFYQALRDYFNKWKFQHPCTGDFVNCINKAAATSPDLEVQKGYTWFFNSMLATDEVCDYKITSIKNESLLTGIKGFFDDGFGKIFKNDSEETREYRSSVFVQRMGTMIMPVEVLVTFENGDTQLFKWDGRGRCKEFAVSSSHKIVSAQIDPEGKNYCDINFVNNSYSLESFTSPAWKYAVKVLFWLENLFQSIAFFA